MSRNIFLLAAVFLFASNLRASEAAPKTDVVPEQPGHSKTQSDNLPNGTKGYIFSGPRPRVTKRPLTSGEIKRYFGEAYLGKDSESAKQVPSGKRGALLKVKKVLDQFAEANPEIVAQFTAARFLNLLSGEKDSAATPVAIPLSAEEQKQWENFLEKRPKFAHALKTGDTSPLLHEPYWHRLMIEPEYSAIYERLSEELKARFEAAKAAKAAADAKAEGKSPAPAVAE